MLIVTYAFHLSRCDFVHFGIVFISCSKPQRCHIKPPEKHYVTIPCFRDLEVICCFVVHHEVYIEQKTRNWLDRGPVSWSANFGYLVFDGQSGLVHSIRHNIHNEGWIDPPCLYKSGYLFEGTFEGWV
jgi:hypothetical protein